MTFLQWAKKAAPYCQTHHSRPSGLRLSDLLQLFIYFIIIFFFPAWRSQWWSEHHYLAAQHDCWLGSWSWQMGRARYHGDTGGRLEQQARLIRSLESPSCLRKQTSVGGALREALCCCTNRGRAWWQLTPFDVRLFHTRDWEYNITVEMLLKTRNHVSKGKGWALEIITSSIVIIAKEKCIALIYFASWEWFNPKLLWMRSLLQVAYLCPLWK